MPQSTTKVVWEKGSRIIWTNNPIVCGPKPYFKKMKELVESMASKGLLLIARILLIVL